MQYRLATIADWPSISEYVHSVDYFMPVDPATLGGHWIVAAGDDGRVHGTIWAFGESPQAYVDYWAGKTGLIAARLGAAMEKMLRTNGVTHVRAVISQDNQPAINLAGALGMIKAGDYYLVHRSL